MPSVNVIGQEVMLRLSDPESRYWEASREFAEREIAPLGAKHDVCGHLEPGIVQVLAARGYLVPFVSKSADSGVRPFVALSLLHEEIGRFCISVRSLLTVHCMVAYVLQRYGSEDQKARWLDRLSRGEVLAAFALSEPLAGSDLAEIQTVAARTDRGWCIEGRKSWTSFCQIAALFLVFCKTEEGTVALLVEREADGVTIEGLTGELMAARASMLGHLSFSSCHVSSANLIGPVGCGTTAVATTALTLGRVSVAAGAIGMMRRCLELSRRFAEERIQSGAPIGANQAISSKLSSMIVNIEAARHLCSYAADLLGRGDRFAAIQACIAKHFAAKACTSVSSDAVQIHGARGFMRSWDVFRLYQDAKLAEIIEGSNEIQDVIISGSGYPATPSL